MNRVWSVVRRSLALSPEGKAFFYATTLVHVALKLLLGLRMAIEDGYGFGSMVAPPQSLVFVGGDVLVCFLFARLSDLFAQPVRRLVQTALLVPLFVFLVTSFIVHTYFKAFVNRGLLEFNGAGAVEITDYTLSGLTVYSLSFVAIAAAAFSWFAIGYRTLENAQRLRGHGPLVVLLASALLLLGYSGTLSAGQSGWLTKNPAYELVLSYVRASRTEPRRASASEALAFREPRPLHGRYASEAGIDVPARPGANVLFLLIESLPLEQTSLGGAKDQLPILTELARDGVFFERFRTVFPATSRSFLTYHCGIYPTTGPSTVTKFRPSYRCDSLISALKAKGYRTGFFTAPMFNYDNLDKSPVVTDYDVYEDFLSLRSRARKDELSAPAVEEEAVVESMLQFLSKPDPRPFWATYFLFWNHAPYRLPFEDISGLPALERYRRTLAYLDRVIRDTLARAERAGLLDNTIIVVAADHGEGFGIHHGNTNHVGHIYEDDVRVPLLIHVPGLGARRSLREASNVDFAPTLARLLGLPRASSWQGQDLLAQDFAPRPTLLFGRASFRTNGIVDGHLKYIEYPDAEARHLYDLSVDPHEQHDLFAERRAWADAYRTLITRWLPVVEDRAWAVHERR